MRRISGSAAGVLVYSAMGLQPAYADADWDRYADSAYQYCDAVILGEFWGQSVGEAKTLIGRKLGWGNGDIVASDIAQARSRGQRCSFADTGFSYSDAEAVSLLWGSDVADAKSAIADKVSVGNRNQADQLVAQARAVGKESLDRGPGGNQNQADFKRYVDSPYQYCDAVILGAYWGESAGAAKVTIGSKIGFGNADVVDANLADARRRGDRCQFHDTGFVYADAEAVAALWGISIGDAKSRLANKVSLGQRRIATEAVSHARTPIAPDPVVNRDAELGRYGESHYEYCDAVILGAYWGESAYEAKVSIGTKLGANNVPGIESALSQARQGGERCRYSDTGFSLDDAELVSRHWRRPLRETKAELAERVSMGERPSVEELIRLASSGRSRSGRY